MSAFFKFFNTTEDDDNEMKTLTKLWSKQMSHAVPWHVSRLAKTMIFIKDSNFLNMGKACVALYRTFHTRLKQEDDFHNHDFGTKSRRFFFFKNRLKWQQTVLTNALLCTLPDLTPPQLRSTNNKQEEKPRKHLFPKDLTNCRKWTKISLWYSVVCGLGHLFQYDALFKVNRRFYFMPCGWSQIVK